MGISRFGLQDHPVPFGELNQALRLSLNANVPEWALSVGCDAAHSGRIDADHTPFRQFELVAIDLEAPFSFYDDVKARSGMAGVDKGQGVGDYGTPEQEIPATGFGPGVAWESCMTMNNHWGYNKHDQNWKSPERLVRNLIDCASKGGNYLLNVGPTSEGLIPGPSVERLAAIGRWMKVNSEAIYGTTASPFKSLPWGRCTQRALSGGKTRLYLHVVDWPKDGRLLVPDLRNTVESATVLATRTKVTTESSTAGLNLAVPADTPDALSSTIVLTVNGRPEIQP